MTSSGPSNTADAAASSRTASSGTRKNSSPHSSLSARRPAAVAARPSARVDSATRRSAAASTSRCRVFATTSLSRREYGSGAYSSVLNCRKNIGRSSWDNDARGMRLLGDGSEGGWRVQAAMSVPDPAQARTLVATVVELRPGVGLLGVENEVGSLLADHDR